jgi:peptidoglycan/xylan/chitin deacetylase (PgdA/CDA1 family)
MMGPLHSLLKRFTGGFALAFHDIPAGRFVELIESFSAFRVVPFPELVERTRTGRRTRGLFAITLDDGVGETVRTVAGVLRAKRWPGTFYVPTGYVEGEGMPFQWWRAIAPLLPPKVVRHGRETIDLSAKGSVARTSKRLERLWRTTPPREYMPMLERLIEVVCAERGLRREQLKPPAAITPGEIRELARDGLLRFESHGMSHTALSALSREEIAAEMRISRDRMAQLSGQPCRHFCYPFGSPESIGPVAPEIARGFYDSAVTMSLGMVDGANPWLVPRIPLYPENSRLVAMCKLGVGIIKNASTGRQDPREDARVPPASARGQAAP